MVEEYGGAYTGQQIDYAIGMVLSGNTGGNNYSTEEQVIGTWIDGKPIYRKVFECTTPSKSTNVTQEVAKFDGNVETVIKLYGILKKSNGQVTQISYNQKDGFRTYLAYNLSSAPQYPGTIRMECSTNDTSLPVTIILECTKTTD